MGELGAKSSGEETVTTATPSGSTEMREDSLEGFIHGGERRAQSSGSVGG